MKRHLSPLVLLAGLAVAQEAPLPSAPAAPAVEPAPVPADPPASTPTADPASTPATTGTTPVDGKSVPGPGSASTEATPAAAGDGFAFHPGLTFGTVTMDGNTWTRLSFQPEIEFGKLGVALDLEMFLDENQNLSTRGWDFDTPRNSWESVLRKIYYVRWDKPGAPYYARVGALEGITLGHGLVAANFGNVSRYPDYKLVGVHTQVNDFGPLGVDVEGVVGSVQDLSRGGPVWALRAGVHPLAVLPLPVPLFSQLGVSAGLMRDQNQYAGLRDRDGDGCPDAVDFDPSRASVCVQRPSPEMVFGTDSVLSLTRGQYGRIEDSLQRRALDSVATAYGARKPFTMIWLQADQPVLRLPLVSLDAYAAWAKPFAGDDSRLVDASGWGMIPLGASSTIGPVRLGAEYRVFQGPFQPGYFNATYDIERTRFLAGQAVTKEMFVYGKDAAERTMLQGYFASAGWNAFDIVDVSGNYTEMFPSRDSAHTQRAMGGRIALGSVVTNLLKKISLAEAYWQKDRVGMDVTDPQGRDAFFDNSIYTLYGFRVGSLLAPGLTLVVDRATTFVRQDDGGLKAMPQMRIETQLKF